MKSPFALTAVLFFSSLSFAQPANTSKRLPPAGIAIPAQVRSSLETGLQKLQREIAAFQTRPQSDWDTLLLPDAKIYEKAARYALEHNEFFRTNEFAIASQLIEEGIRRIQSLANGKAPWTTSDGLVVRAYKSRLDGSIQPYGLVVPPGYNTSENKKNYRLEVWLHGRDETLTELKFIHDRSTKAGEFQPPDAIVLHPYGRYCNAFKFAGEIDVMEAMEAASLVSYPTSPAVLRGFSMGGAGAWHLAAHHADRWVCASPGAGFAETARYMHLNPENVPWYERKLWQWYDATDYALNLFHCPVVAYSGELDKQRQAAEVMSAAMAKDDLPLIHLIGPKTEHRYEPETKRLLSHIVDTFASIERPQTPREIRFTTRTLRYPKMHWLVLLGLDKHWERADAWAKLDPFVGSVTLSLTNVSSFALDLQRERPNLIHEVTVNGSKIILRANERTNLLVLDRVHGVWTISSFPDGKKRKYPGHQGPIDDAFMDSFLFVKPSGNPFHKETSAWINEELKRAEFEWRAQFRGDAPTVKDADLTEDQIRNSNLVLWGDPQSNEVIRKILPNLPFKWSTEKIQVGSISADSRTHLPLMIYPNPLNAEKYIVLNSGFTFRGFGSNADQTPKLPDYALLDISRPDPFKSGVAAAGFFDEEWKLPPDE